MNVKVNVKGQLVTLRTHKAWKDITALSTAARWKAGCGATPAGCFEIRDETGRLLKAESPIGDWLAGHTLYVNLLAGIGA